jgi:anaerobic magnesium-protoporphyrin IX monomethyl ester cyclase
LQITLIAINCRYTHSCPALFYVRHALRRHLPGVACNIRQFTLNDPYYSTLRRIAEEKPAAIFFSVYIWSSSYIRRLAHDLANLLPSVPIVLGGPQVSYGDAGFTDFPPHCTVVRGAVEGLPDQFFHDLRDNCLQREYRASGVKQFSLPYEEHDFTDQLQNRQVYYESSRGCPFSCTYCLSSVENGVQHQELGLVRAELQEILRQRPGTVRFVDRTFNASPGRALEIWRFLADQEGSTLFHFEIAPELFTEEMFVFLAGVAPGRFQFEIGLQSTDPRVLAAVRRPADLERIRANLLRLLTVGNIHLHVDLILGLPFETRESFRRSFNEVFSLFPHYIQIGLLKVLPGTALAKEAEDFGLISCGQPPYEILATRWLPAEELADLYWLGECAEAFFNNRYFKTMLSYLRGTEPDPFGFFEELLAVCRLRRFFDLAPTQDLMCSLLLELAATRANRELFLELLRFDWLLSGQRNPPEYLGGSSAAVVKELLRQNLPQNWEPHYTYRTREEFFKQGIFAEFSGAALKAAGITDDRLPGFLCFPTGRATGVLKQRQVLLLPFRPGAVSVTKFDGNTK